MKKRPLFLVCLSLLCGMYALSVFKSQQMLNVSVVAVLVLIVSAIRKRNFIKCILPVMMLVAFVVGMLYFESVDSIQSRPLFAYNDTTVQTTAEVTTIPEVNKNSISYIANMHSVTVDEEVIPVNEKVRFVYYIDETNEDRKIVLPALGDLVVVDSKIKIPKDSMNSGGFDYARYLKTDNIFFLCEIENEDFEIIEHRDRFFSHRIENFRQTCKSIINESFPVEEAGILKAFVLGDNSEVTEETDVAFSKSGLSHILAVSGLHVSAFLSAVAFLLRMVKASKRKEMIISVVCAIIFVIFTGAPISAIRAGTMSVLTLVAKLLYRRADSLTSLSLAAATLSLFNPLAIYDGGFMLSFSATAGIILFYNNLSDFMSNLHKKVNPDSKLGKHLSAMCNAVAVGIAAQIFTIPLLVYMFNGFSLMSVIATMIVAQFLDVMLIVGLLFILVSFISAKIAWLISLPLLFLTRVMLYVAEFFSSFPFSRILYGVLTPFILLLYALSVCSVMSIIKRKKIVYIISLTSLGILSLMGVINYYLNFNVASVSFLNVGQGDCALIRAPGDCDILIDAGGYSLNEKTGEYTISPYLLKNGVTDIEYLMISHTDIDHTVGISGILKTHKIEKIIIPYGHQYSENYKQIEKLVGDYGVDILLFSEGDSLRINEKMTINAISPDIGQYKYSRKTNDTGMVLRLDYGESSFLFSGDISSSIEKHLLNENANIRDVDVLKVAHHGSKNSTCLDFLDAADSEYAVISVGKNSFGHPDSETVSRLLGKSVQVYITDIHKDVTFYFDESKIKGVKCSEYKAGE